VEASDASNFDVSKVEKPAGTGDGVSVEGGSGAGDADGEI